jgi:hypothetical protein
MELARKFRRLTFIGWGGKGPIGCTSGAADHTRFAGHRVASEQ